MSVRLVGDQRAGGAGQFHAPIAEIQSREAVFRFDQSQGALQPIEQVIKLIGIAHDYAQVGVKNESARIFGEVEQMIADSQNLGFIVGAMPMLVDEYLAFNETDRASNLATRMPIKPHSAQTVVQNLLKVARKFIDLQRAEFTGENNARAADLLSFATEISQEYLQGAIREEAMREIGRLIGIIQRPLGDMLEALRV